MENQSNFFAIMSRMKYVGRWGLMRNSRTESLSDHTLDVVMITHALVVIANTYFGKSLDEGRAGLLAAFHDAPEIITGDLPTPVKYFDPEIKTAYDHVEESAKKKMIEQLPSDMQETYESLMSGKKEGDETLLKYVKAADKISALIKCVEEEKMGNEDFKDAKLSTTKAIEEFDMPEVKFFMENFFDGYYETLDKQTR